MEGFPVDPVMNTIFDRDGRTWRVSVVAGTFIIGTAINAVLDSHGEPSRDSDIIKVMLNVSCDTCIYDGMQLVERKCQRCTTTIPNGFVNWSLKL